MTYAQNNNHNFLIAAFDILLLPGKLVLTLKKYKPNYLYREKTKISVSNSVRIL